MGVRPNSPIFNFPLFYFILSKIRKGKGKSCPQSVSLIFNPSFLLFHLFLIPASLLIGYPGNFDFCFSNQMGNDSLRSGLMQYQSLPLSLWIFSVSIKKQTLCLFFCLCQRPPLRHKLDIAPGILPSCQCYAYPRKTPGNPDLHHGQI